MRELFSVGIKQIYDDIRFFQEQDASKRRENYVKYATTKKASLKRKQKKRGVRK